MAKITLFKTSSGSKEWKNNFHFNTEGAGKFFQFFNKIIHGVAGKAGGNEEIIAPEQSEISKLLSKLEIDGNINSQHQSELKIEAELSVDEIKELGEWSIGFLKAEGSYIKDIFKSGTEMYKDIADVTNQLFQPTQSVKVEKPSEEKADDVKTE